VRARVLGVGVHVQGGYLLSGDARPEEGGGRSCEDAQEGDHTGDW